MVERRMNISMASVYPSVVCEGIEKTETRRDWPKVYANRFYKGQEVFFTSGRWNENERIALAEILEEPFLENMLKAHSNSGDVERLYIAEGFRYLDRDYEQKQLKFATGEWCKADEMVFVIRFRRLKVIDCMREKYDTQERREKCRNAMYKKLTGQKICQESVTPNEVK